MDITRTVLIDLENQAWAALKNGDADFYRNYLSENVFAISASGILERDDLIEQAAEKRSPVQGYRIENPRVSIMTKDTAFVTSRATFAVKQGGKDVNFSIYSTTVYARINGEWRAVLLQQTPVK